MGFRVDTRSDVPPSRQLVEAVLDRVASGALAPGDRLPSVRALAEERWMARAELDAFSTHELAALLHRTIVTGERTELADPRLLAAFGRGRSCTAAELWQALASELRRDDADWRELAPTLGVILEHGPLARRLLALLGDSPDRARIDSVYAELARCLVEGRLLT